MSAENSLSTKQIVPVDVVRDLESKKKGKIIILFECELYVELNTIIVHPDSESFIFFRKIIFQNHEANTNY